MVVVVDNGFIHTPQTWNHRLWNWYCPPFESKIQLSKAEVKTNRIIASAQFQVELSVTLPITYSLCVQHCNNEKCVTSTCFKIRVNNHLVNTTEQPKWKMPDHVYHGNMCFVDLMYIFDMYSISAYYMISCYYVYKRGHADIWFHVCMNMRF